MKKLEPNEDSFGIPGVTVEAGKIKLDTNKPVDKWVEDFPIASVFAMKGFQHFTYRLGETKVIEGKTYFRRIRVAVSLTDWQELTNLP